MSANYVNIAGGTTYTLTLSPENIVSQKNQFRLICKTAGGAITIILPSISAFGNGIDAKIFIDDTDDMAATNNITIQVGAGITIANASSFVMNQNGQKVEVYISSKTEYGVLGSGGGAAIGASILSVGEGGYPMQNNPTNAIVASGIEKAYANLYINATTGQLLESVSFPDLLDIDGGIQFDDATTTTVQLQEALFPKLELLTTLSSGFVGLPNLTTIDLSKLKKVVAGVNSNIIDISYLALNNCDAVTSFSFPALTDIEALVTSTGVVAIVSQNNATITNFDFPVLVNTNLTFAVSIFAQNCPLLTSMAFPLLQTGGAGLGTFIGTSQCNLLTTMSLPAAVSNVTILAFDNAIMSSVSAPLLTSGVGITLDTLPLLTSVNLPLVNITASFYPIGITVQNCPLLPSFSLPMATKSNGLQINNNATLASVNLPLYNETLTASNCSFYNNPLLTAIALPALTKVAAALNVVNNTTLASLSLPLLADVGATVYIDSNPALPSVDLSALTILNGSNMNIQNNTVLDTITLSPAVDCLSLSLLGNALTQVSVDDILAKLDTAGYSNGMVDVSGGTSATPSAAGLVSKANLVGKGWTVFNN
jgi:hypothetical protein